MWTASPVCGYTGQTIEIKTDDPKSALNCIFERIGLAPGNERGNLLKTPAERLSTLRPARASKIREPSSL
jgi:hypothetical protein